MSTGALAVEPQELQEGVGTPESPLTIPEAAPALPASVKRHWIQGTSALAAAVMVERGTGLLANVLAARIGGAGVFGSYSLAISTANNIGTYAAGGIGATATRFSGKYTYGSAGYSSLAQALTVVSLTSAALAALALWAGAVPLAHLLGKPALAGLLRWASLSAAGMVLLECARGFFVGQRRIAALLLLSLAVGAGLLLLLPMGAHLHNPTRMVVLQAAVCCGAVLGCLTLAGPLALRAKTALRERLPLGPMLREIWGFGLVQLSGMVAANLAGWWLTTLIARSDTTLAQVGFFAIASQMRNLAGVVPGLLTEGSYAVMATGGEAAGSKQSAPHRVMALSSFAALFASVVVASVGIVAAPWLLHLLYGRAYAAADVAFAVALALAVAHMGNAPVSARLTIVNIRTTGVINTIWAVFVGLAATVVLLHGGGAWQGLAILLAAHLLSATLVLRSLKREDSVPAGVGAAYFVGALGSAALAGMALLRSHVPQHAMVISLVMFAAAVIQLAALLLLGRRHHWLPSRTALQNLRTRVLSRMTRRDEEVAHV